MADRTLADFVKDALAKGAGRDEIKLALSSAGWSEAQIDDALDAWAEVSFVTPVPKPKPYLSAREAFLYLVLFILLGVVATNLGVLWFQFIDLALPDPADNAYAAMRAEGAIRWSVAGLVVAAPLYILLTIGLGRARRRNPALQESRLRKWLTYLTLVVAASVLVGDLISVLYQFLAGELTLRFGLKVLAIAVIAGAVFLYYGDEAERGDAKGPRALASRLLGYAAAGAIAASIVFSFFAMRAPNVVRAQEIDARRLSALTEIATAVDCYWTENGELPASLEALQTAHSGRGEVAPAPDGCRFELSSIADPVTGAPYAYRPLDEGRFEICATFEHGWSDRRAPPEVAGRYIAGRPARMLQRPEAAGERCYELQATRIENATE